MIDPIIIIHNMFNINMMIMMIRRVIFQCEFRESMNHLIYI